MAFVLILKRKGVHTDAGEHVPKVKGKA